MAEYRIVQDEFKLFEARNLALPWKPSPRFREEWKKFDDGDCLEAFRFAKEMSVLFAHRIRSELPCDAFDNLHCDEMFDDDEFDEDMPPPQQSSGPARVDVGQQVVGPPPPLEPHQVDPANLDDFIAPAVSPVVSKETRRVVTCARVYARGNRAAVGLVIFGGTHAESWMTYPEVREFLDMADPSVREIEALSSALRGAHNECRVDYPGPISMHSAAIVTGSMFSYKQLTMLVVRTHAWHVFIPDIDFGHMSGVFEDFVRLYLRGTMGAVDIHVYRVKGNDHVSIFLLMLSDFFKNGEVILAKYIATPPATRRAMVIARIVECDVGDAGSAARAYALRMYPSQKSRPDM